MAFGSFISLLLTEGVVFWNIDNGVSDIVKDQGL